MSKADEDKIKDYTQEVGLYINDNFPQGEYTAPEVFAFLSTITTFVLQRFYLEDSYDMHKVYALSLLALLREDMPMFYSGEDGTE